MSLRKDCCDASNQSLKYPQICVCVLSISKAHMKPNHVGLGYRVVVSLVFFNLALGKIVGMHIMKHKNNTKYVCVFAIS